MKAYLIRLTAVSIIASLVRRLAPESSSGKGARLGAGLLVLLTALGPLGNMDLLAAAHAVAADGISDPLTTQTVDRAANALLNGLITDTAESYILDKASALGADLTVTVTTSVENGYPVPWAVTLRGTCSQEAKGLLTDSIQKELDIPEARQEWICM